MMLFDTDILSNFGKIGRFNLLFDVFEDENFFVSINVLNEIILAKEAGYNYAEEILFLIDEGKIRVVSPSDEEIDETEKLPQNFGYGEKDSIAIAKKRSAIFVTNEKKLLNFCERNSISCVTLNSILKLLWKEGIKTKDEVKEIMSEIEEKDKVIIPSKEEILAD